MRLTIPQNRRKKLGMRRRLLLYFILLLVIFLIATIGTISIIGRTWSTKVRTDALHDVYSGEYSAGRTVKIAPLDGSEEWEIAVMLPQPEYDAKLRDQNMILILLLVLGIAVALSASVLLSFLYVRPITEGFNMILQGSSERSKIPEINELIDFIAGEYQSESNEGEQSQSEPNKGEQNKSGQSQAEQNEIAQSRKGEGQSGHNQSEENQYKSHAPKLQEEDSPLAASYNIFKKRLQTLTIAEREIYDMYLSGATAQRIAEARFTSVSTVRFHSRNIYTKLGVSSRNELLLISKIMQGKGFNTGETV